MATLRDQILERLEMRRMAIDGYKAMWCDSCLRCAVHDPAVKGSFVLISSGSEKCIQPMMDGTISECIDAFRTASQTDEPECRDPPDNGVLSQSNLPA